MAWMIFHRALWYYTSNDNSERNPDIFFQIPDTIIFTDKAPVEWYYSQSQKSGVFRHSIDEISLQSIFRRLVESSKSIIVASMIWYDAGSPIGRRLQIKYFTEEELHVALFSNIHEKNSPNSWILQGFIGPNSSEKVMITVSEKVGLNTFSVSNICNKHDFHNHKRIKDSCLTIESVDPLHVETRKSSIRVRDSAIDISELIVESLSNLLGINISKELMTFYFKFDKSGKPIFLWGYWDDNNYSNNAVDSSNNVYNLIIQSTGIYDQHYRELEKDDTFNNYLKPSSEVREENSKSSKNSTAINNSSTTTSQMMPKPPSSNKSSFSSMRRAGGGGGGGGTQGTGGGTSSHHGETARAKEIQDLASVSSEDSLTLSQSGSPKKKSLTSTIKNGGINQSSEGSDNMLLPNQQSSIAVYPDTSRSLNKGSSHSITMQHSIDNNYSNNNNDSDYYDNEENEDNFPHSSKNNRQRQDTENNLFQPSTFSELTKNTKKSKLGTISIVSRSSKKLSARLLALSQPKASQMKKTVEKSTKSSDGHDKGYRPRSPLNNLIQAYDPQKCSDIAKSENNILAIFKRKRKLNNHVKKHRGHDTEEGVAAIEGLSNKNSRPMTPAGKPPPPRYHESDQVGSNPLEWSKQFGAVGRRKRYLLAISAKLPESPIGSAELLCDLVGIMVSELCNEVLSHMSVASGVWEQLSMNSDPPPVANQHNNNNNNNDINNNSIRSEWIDNMIIALEKQQLKNDPNNPNNSNNSHPMPPSRPNIDSNPPTRIKTKNFKHSKRLNATKAVTLTEQEKSFLKLIKRISYFPNIHTNRNVMLSLMHVIRGFRKTRKQASQTDEARERSLSQSSEHDNNNNNNNNNNSESGNHQIDTTVTYNPANTTATGTGTIDNVVSEFTDFLLSVRGTLVDISSMLSERCADADDRNIEHQRVGCDILRTWHYIRALPHPPPMNTSPWSPVRNLSNSLTRAIDTNDMEGGTGEDSRDQHFGFVKQKQVKRPHSAGTVRSRKKVGGARRPDGIAASSPLLDESTAMSGTGRTSLASNTGRSVVSQISTSYSRNNQHHIIGVHICVERFLTALGWKDATLMTDEKQLSDVNDIGTLETADKSAVVKSKGRSTSTPTHATLPPKPDAEVGYTARRNSLLMRQLDVSILNKYEEIIPPLGSSSSSSTGTHLATTSTHPQSHTPTKNDMMSHRNSKVIHTIPSPNRQIEENLTVNNEETSSSNPIKLNRNVSNSKRIVQSHSKLKKASKYRKSNHLLHFLNYLSSTSRMTSKHRTILVIAVLSDVVRAQLLNIYTLVRNAWASVTPPSLREMQSVLRLGNTTANKHALLEFRSWLLSNQRTDASFRPAMLTHVELALQKLFSFWPRLELEVIENDQNGGFKKAYMDEDDANVGDYISSTPTARPSTIPATTSTLAATTSTSTRIPLHDYKFVENFDNGCLLRLVWPDKFYVNKLFRDPLTFESNMFG